MWNKERTKEALASSYGMQHQSRTDCSCVHLCEEVQKQKIFFFEFFFFEKAKKSNFLPENNRLMREKGIWFILVKGEKEQFFASNAKED